jgi:hypothetical protein
MIMTGNQWKMLEILDRWGGEGMSEVECQWGGYDFGDGETAEAKAFHVNRLVVAGLVRSLVAKGYATNDANGYDITYAGRRLLDARRGHYRG